ncbi:MAG: mannose-1-phosphate guanylyltransferase [Proteobacteria bacterium]|nr:mannose-1-phosphate guanylyltransferase [Pseudomonadota bacterium]
MNWAVIMAGGNGTRFWPLSNTEHPKQFLRLLGEKTPAESCLERLQKVIPIERIIIVASAKHKDSLQNALPSFPLTQVLWEPIGRNTAACIAWATEVIRQKDHHARIGVFPSDHAIADENAFAQSLTQAYEAAQNRIVLFGIEPSHPETGYGYIEEGENIANNLCKVAAFREKPDIQTAKEYLAKGCFLWNSGMFIFDAETMHEELNRHVPQIVTGIQNILTHPQTLETEFPKLLSISIDYAVMEHTDRAAVMRASFPWDDLGTWDSIRKYYTPNKAQNAARGNHVSVDCHHTFTYADDGRIIATLGLKNIIVVSTQDAVLVLDDSRAQDVRKIVDKL